jgi:hypothetical protein
LKHDRARCVVGAVSERPEAARWNPSQSDTLPLIQR